ncbi:lauroyl-Kdo(2)-lipid IV(A) myristoyltransferase [Thaumasiovibrio sp. DFM-14]|uniref:lauroyl-Kdo(2)-lipid IV(A) myristoyltransferase n=1 Tax=Thaumasiovibrio sp. DFM-14 TaxID=3384792 RepID=UPI0039A0B3FB
MSTPRNDFDPIAYNPTFKNAWLKPKYWGTWLTVLLGLPLALTPVRFRAWIAMKLASKLAKKNRGSIYKAKYNLKACFPEKTEQERHSLLTQCLTTAGTYLLGFAAVSLRSRHWLQQHSDIKGMENLTQHTEQGENVILFVPHTWAIDIAAILMASYGMPVAAFANKQKDEVLDYLMHRQRVQYGGRVYDRSTGIKPFIKAVRDGYLGYYLPDEDHGPENSVFAPFFGTTKATLPGLGKLAKVTRAHIVPVTSMYNASTGRFEIEIHPAIEGLASGDEAVDARIMNACVEKQIAPYPEQYMWILKLLKTQPDGKDPYEGR